MLSKFRNLMTGGVAGLDLLKIILLWIGYIAIVAFIIAAIVSVIMTMSTEKSINELETKSGTGEENKGE